jgi:hypothetical protein
MKMLTSARPIHLYDTQLHRIACEDHIADDHSTKHKRIVTCAACMTVVREGMGDPPRAPPPRCPTAED